MWWRLSVSTPTLQRWCGCEQSYASLPPDSDHFHPLQASCFLTLPLTYCAVCLCVFLRYTLVAMGSLNTSLKTLGRDVHISQKEIWNVSRPPVATRSAEVWPLSLPVLSQPSHRACSPDCIVSHWAASLRSSDCNAQAFPTLHRSRIWNTLGIEFLNRKWKGRI